MNSLFLIAKIMPRILIKIKKSKKYNKYRIINNIIIIQNN